jgi:peptide deformylase
VDVELRKIIGQMFELMYGAKGIGLAANQVDLPLRVFIMNLAGKPGEGQEMVFINPVISHPKGSEEAEEGCLSLPGLYGQVVRPKTIKVQAYNLQGQEINAEIGGLEARCVQHELDHLNGVLFIDRIPELARQAFDDQLYELEADYQGQLTTGEIAADERQAQIRSEWENRYC